MRKAWYASFAIAASSACLAQVPDAQLVNLRVYSHDNVRLGFVSKVLRGDSSGLIEFILIYTQGHGGRCVAIPRTKFARFGEIIGVGMLAAEIRELPEDKRCG